MSEALEIARRALEGVADKLDPPALQALAQACYLVSAADGAVGAQELDHSVATLSALGSSVPGLEAVCAELRLLAGQAGRPDERAVIAAIARAVTDPASRRALLTAATCVAYADDTLDFEEEIVLLTLADALGMHKDEAWALMESARGRVTPAPPSPQPA
jgi:tellurite resistance protein